MCKPATAAAAAGAPASTAKKEKAAASKSLAVKAALCLVVLVYFFPALTYRATPVRNLDWRLKSPIQKMRLDVLGSRIVKLRLKRDGGLYLEALMEMRIHNALALPLKVKGINMTASLRTIGSNDLYEVGYQELPAFSAPSFGSTLTTAKCVFHDLRPGVLLAQIWDVVKQTGAQNPTLQTHTAGQVRLW